MTTPAEKTLSKQVTKPGYLTTEFWKSAIYAVISILTGLGVIGANVPAEYKSVIDSVALLAGAGCIIGYSLSRGKTKAATIEAAAKVILTELESKTPSAPNAKQASR